MNATVEQIAGVLERYAACLRAAETGALRLEERIDRLQLEVPGPESYGEWRLPLFRFELRNEPTRFAPAELVELMLDLPPEAFEAMLGVLRSIAAVERTSLGSRSAVRLRGRTTTDELAHVRAQWKTLDPRRREHPADTTAAAEGSPSALWEAATQIAALHDHTKASPQLRLPDDGLQPPSGYFSWLQTGQGATEDLAYALVASYVVPRAETLQVSDSSGDPVTAVSRGLWLEPSPGEEPTYQSLVQCWDTPALLALVSGLGDRKLSVQVDWLLRRSGEIGRQLPLAVAERRRPLNFEAKLIVFITFSEEVTRYFVRDKRTLLTDLNRAEVAEVTCEQQTTGHDSDYKARRWINLLHEAGERLQEAGLWTRKLITLTHTDASPPSAPPSTRVHNLDSHTSKPTPLTAKTPEEFAATLRAWWDLAGTPTYRELERRCGGRLSRTSIHNLLTGDRKERLPRLRDLKVLLASIGASEEDIQLWFTAWWHIFHNASIPDRTASVTLVSIQESGTDDARPC